MEFPLEEFKQLRENGLTIQQIADFYHASPSSIKRFIKKNSLEKGVVKIDKDDFIENYNKRFSDEELSKIYNLSVYKIANYRKKWKLPSWTDKIREENKEKFLELYKEGKNDSEIGNILGINHVTIKNWRESEGLSSNFEYKKSFDTDKFMELYNLGYTYEKIAEELGVGQTTISNYAISLGLTNNLSNKITPTYEEEQIILGTLYGDGSMPKLINTHNASLNFAHSLKQENYCKWKAEKLIRFKSHISYKTEHDKRTGKDYHCCYVHTGTSTYLTSIYYKYYKEDRSKFIDKETLYKLDGLGVAIWFMDDGYKDSASYKIATNCFSLEELEIIVQFFKEKFEIEVSIQSTNHIIYIKASSRDKFTKLIKPYIHKDCLYKLHTPN